MNQVIKVFAVILTLISASASGNEAVNGQDDHVTVRGKVSFVKKKTVVASGICEDRKCPVPEPYWALVIQRDAQRVELNEIFARGSEAAPESVVVMGTVIRPGSQVEIEGRVEFVTEDFMILTDVDRAGILMDLISRANEANLGDTPLWTCRSAGETNPSVRAKIWQTGDVREPSGYVLEIWTQGSLAWASHQISLPYTSLEIKPQQLFFHGQTRMYEAELILDQSLGRFTRVPGILHLWGIPGAGSGPHPLEVQDLLLCDRGGIIQ